MLLFENSGCEGMFIVGVENGHSLLHNDRPMIEFFVDEVHGAAGYLYAIGECLLLRF